MLELRTKHLRQSLRLWPRFNGRCFNRGDLISAPGTKCFGTNIIMNCTAQQSVRSVLHQQTSRTQSASGYVKRAPSTVRARRRHRPLSPLCSHHHRWRHHRTRLVRLALLVCALLMGSCVGVGALRTCALLAGRRPLRSQRRQNESKQRQEARGWSS